MIEWLNVAYAYKKKQETYKQQNTHGSTDNRQTKRQNQIYGQLTNASIKKPTNKTDMTVKYEFQKYDK